jgi:uncharacterized protein (TIGR03084 family)
MADRAVLAGVCADLAQEHASLDAIVADITPGQWQTPTPAPGWTVRDQISHLAWVDERATEAIVDPERFADGMRRLLEQAPEDPMLVGVEEGRSRSAGGVLAWWRDSRQAFLAAMGDADPSARIPWYGPPMSAVSFVTARLMETWAHGQDVVDALGVRRPPSARLRHVAHIGVSALPFAFQARGMAVPSDPVRVELEGPTGETWTWGPAEATDVVRGPALDFCLVVTQRRHVADTGLEVVGAVAAQWMQIAQAFAGPPGEGRAPGQFAAAGGAPPGG